VARDVLGLRYTSSPVNVAVANGLPTATRFEETDLSTTYTVGWIHYVTGRPFSGGTAAYSPKTDGRATFTFTGTSVKWIGFRGPQTGIALVFLDGHFQAQVDTYSPTEQVKAVIYSAEGLPAGSHTLWVEVTGLKNSASADSIVIVDAFDAATQSPPPTIGTPTAIGRRFQETDPSANYTPGWNQADMTAAWSGGTAATSTAPGAQATFAFTGTSVNWIGFRGPRAGIARVFVDGVFKADVDLYEPTRLQAVVFSASQMANTSHTLTIEVTGLRNAASTDTQVVVDAFDTRSRFEEAHPSLAYTGTWELTVSRAWSDRTAVFTWEANAQATFAFTGTSVRWIGYRGPIGGIAEVFLDGTFVGQIDTYRADEEAKAVVYSAKGLAAGNHTLRIRVTGEMNPLSQKPFIALDAFDVNF
jgi:predicted secreted Zn-dependent protease